MRYRVNKITIIEYHNVIILLEEICYYLLNGSQHIMTSRRITNQSTQINANYLDTTNNLKRILRKKNGVFR